MNKILSLIIIFFLSLSCSKKRAENEHTEIENYVKENNLSGQFTNSGLWFSLDVLGTGAHPSKLSTVTVKYKGYLLNQSIFDQSDDLGVTFSLSNVILGWQEGIPKYKVGGKGKLIIPSTLGYGNKKVGTIPKNSVLIFDIELLDVL